MSSLVLDVATLAIAKGQVLAIQLSENMPLDIILRLWQLRERLDMLGIAYVIIPEGVKLAVIDQEKS